MGLRYNFICPSCEYSAIVEGKEGKGFYSTFKTFQCKDCKVLVDILMESKPPEISFVNSHPTCPDCSSENVIPWSGHHPNCPKCEATMEVAPFRELWD